MLHDGNTSEREYSLFARAKSRAGVRALLRAYTHIRRMPRSASRGIAFPLLDCAGKEPDVDAAYQEKSARWR